MINLNEWVKNKFMGINIHFSRTVAVTILILERLLNIIDAHIYFINTAFVLEIIWKINK